MNRIKKLIQIKKNENEALGYDKVKSPIFLKFDRYTQKAYNALLKIPIVRVLVIRVRRRIETLALYDEYTLRREVMKIICTILLIFSLVLLVLISIRPSYLIVFWVLLGILMISGIVIDLFIYRVEVKLLSQLKEFMNKVRFYYHQTKMVDESVFEALQFAGPEIKAHAERIYKILMSIHSKKELAHYEEVAPTRYLRIFAGLSLFVKDKGDKIDDKGSAYLNSLSAIHRELNDELIFRSKLSYALRMITTIALVPIFLAMPVKSWSIHSFPTTELFYDSRIGFFAEISVYLISIGCYLIVRKMKQVSEITKELNPNRIKWEAWLLNKSKFLNRLSIALSPEKYTKKYFKLKELIKNANASLKVKEVTLQRILTTTAVLLLLVCTFTVSHYIQVKNVLNKNQMSSLIFVSALSEQEELERLQQTEYDKEILTKLKSHSIQPSEEDLKVIIAQSLNANVDSLEVDNSYNRIVSKWETIQDAYLQWWEVLISVVIAFLASYLPIYLLYLKSKARLKQMELEVYQLLVIITILREFEGMSVYQILEWMERFSITFKKSLIIAIEEFDGGPGDALDKLANTNTFEPFQQIVARLQLALERLSIKEVFEDIEIDREFYLTQRREEQQRTVESKATSGQFLGLIPAYALVIIYLILPLVYLAISESGKMYDIFN